MDHAQLTKKQKAFYTYIREYQQEYDIWPTYREIADKFGFRSPNSVTQNLQSLVKKGYLIKGEDEEYELKSRYDIPEQGSTGIPVRGLIAAGSMQEAVDMDLGMITMKHLFPNLDKIFALRVSGMSMKDAGINDGDFVLLTHEEPRNGEIGAVLYNGETSLKRIYKNEDGLKLEPANEEFNAIHIEPDESEEVNVLGKYIGHVSKSGVFKA